MTISDTHTAILTRIGWRNDNTVDLSYPLSANNILSDSNRFFQSEHSVVTLRNILDCQPNPEMDKVEFQEYLDTMRSDVVQQVLNDVFERDYVHDDLLTLYPTAFDNVILLRMVISVSELVMTATRSNRTKRFSDDFLGKLNYDIYRETVNKFANSTSMYNHTMGIATRYSFGLQSLRRRFGDQRNLLKTITKGQVYEPSSSKCFWGRFGY